MNTHHIFYTALQQATPPGGAVTTPTPTPPGGAVPLPQPPTRKPITRHPPLDVWETIGRIFREGLQRLPRL